MRTAKYITSVFVGLSLAIGASGCTITQPTEPIPRDTSEAPVVGNTLIVRGLTIESQYDAMPSTDDDYIEYVKFVPDARTQDFIQEATYNKHTNLIEYVEKVYPSPEGWNLIAVDPINSVVDLGSREYSLLFERTR